MTVGIFNTGNFTTDLAKKSFAGMITRLMPGGAAPLFALTSMIPEETATNTEHGYYSKTMIFPEMKINDAGGFAAAATTLTVDSTANLLPGMILRNERTLENVLINTVPSTTQVTVTRAVGTVSAAAINDNDDFFQVGNAFEESSIRPTANNIIPVRITNYTQIFRNTWALSGSSEAVQVIAGQETSAESRQDCAAFHAVDIEKAIFFGQKSTGTRNGQPFRTMDGIYNVVSDISNYPSSYASTNVNAAGATTNWTQLEGFLDPMFDQATDPMGSQSRTMFCGGAAIRVINNICRLNGDYQLMQGQTSFGLRFKTLELSRGTINLIEHPLFNTNSTWQKMAIAVDIATFRLAYLKGRKTQNKEFNNQGNTAQDNGIDAIGGTLTTECTALFKNVPANAIITNLTAGAAG